MGKRKIDLIEYLIVLMIIAILAVIAIPAFINQGKVGRPILEPLVEMDESIPPLSGTVFKVDASNPALLSAQMVMVELRLDKGQKTSAQYIACPAPIDDFKVGDRATMKAFYFRPNNVDRVGKSGWILIKQE